MHLKDAKTLIKTLFKEQINTGERFAIELQSGPGIGKSDGIRQCAEELTKELDEPVTCSPFFLTTVEQPDIRGFGIPAKDVDGTPVMRYTKAPWMPKAGAARYGIIFLDEFRQASHDVQKPTAELFLNGRVGESELPIGWMVVAASNREKDRSGVQRELAFITNRRMLVTVDPNLDAWVEWAETHDIPWHAIAYAKSSPGDVFADSIPDKSGPFCTPRSFVKMSRMIGKLDMNLFMHAAAGLVGEGVAAKFVSFLRVAEQLPAFEDIVANPKKTRLPDKDRPDAQYATMQMIAHRLDKETAVPAFEYLKRMTREFQVSGIKAALRRCPQIAHSKDFSVWIRANTELLMNANLLDPQGGATSR